MPDYTLHLISGPLRFGASEDDAKRLATELQTHNDEVVRLRAEVERLTAVVKAANAQAEHFERQWYLREAEVEALRSLVGELATYDHYSTEYDGRVIVLCPDCGEQDGIHTAGCAFVRAKAQIDAASAAQGERG